MCVCPGCLSLGWLASLLNTGSSGGGEGRPQGRMPGLGGSRGSTGTPAACHAPTRGLPGDMAGPMGKQSSAGDSQEGTQCLPIL